MPVIGAGAEVEPGSVVTGVVPAGERWSGSPARRVGRAGEHWPELAPAASGQPRRWKLMYAVGLVFLSMLPLAAALPDVMLLHAAGGLPASIWSAVRRAALAAPLLAAGFLASYALLVAIAFRVTSRLVRPGWHPDNGVTAWALWFSESLMARAARSVVPALLQSLHAPVAATARHRCRRTHRGLHCRRLESLRPARGGQLRRRRRRLRRLPRTRRMAARNGDRRSATVRSSATARSCARGHRSATTASSASSPRRLSSPAAAPPGSAYPALELPRVPEEPDPARTVTPSRRLVAARGAMDGLRLLFPTSVSIVLGACVLLVLGRIGAAAGVWAMLLAAPLVLLAASMGAATITIAMKWLAMGRYRRDEHPLWSFFVWRDEFINSCQEQLAGAWLLTAALGSPLLPAYLRAMGAHVGADVWFETLAVTEFDLVTLGDGCAVNRGACVETHLFHDRVMRTGPAHLGRDSTLGPHSAVLPDTLLGSGCSVGARSVVMRGEQLPPHTRWHGAPVEAC